MYFCNVLFHYKRFQGIRRFFGRLIESLLHKTEKSSIGTICKSLYEGVIITYITFPLDSLLSWKFQWKIMSKRSRSYEAYIACYSTRSLVVYL